MKTKLAILREMMAEARWRDALKLASSWPDATKEVRCGWEAFVRPDFQRQLGRNPDTLVAAGIEALRRRFG